MTYEEGGPIFVYVGGDFEIGSFWIEHGHLFDIARDLNAIIFAFETRFFGQNRPTIDTSTGNLRFLSTEQILADMAQLIDHIKREDPRLADAKVILAGSQFGGNIATWFRVKYPHYVDGVWSSSSYIEARANFREYFEAIGDNLWGLGSADCFRRTWRAFRTMENLVEGGRSEVLNEMFHLCHPLDVGNDLEVKRFFVEIAETVSTGVVNGGRGAVDDMCEMLTNSETTNDLVAFADWFSYEHIRGGCFQQSFQEVVDFHSEPEWSSIGVIYGRRQSFYLQCTEYGWFTTTDSANQPFGTRITLSYYTEMCRQVFGDWISEEAMQENVNRTNAVFGGVQPVITNAFFTNGGLDPHRLTNIQADIGTTVEAQTLPSECPWGNRLVMIYDERFCFQIMATSGTCIH